MAVHRPLVLQHIEGAASAENPITVPYKDGVRLVREVFEPVTAGRYGPLQPSDWEYSILGKGNDSGIALWRDTLS